MNTTSNTNNTINKIGEIVILIGRNKFYPLLCVFLVTLVFLYTAFNDDDELDLRYSISYFGAICGLLCVILLAKRKNAGNILGMFAVTGEGTANFLGGNIGASLPMLYHFATHIYGLMTWSRNQNEDHQVNTRSLHESSFLYTLIFLICAVFFNIYITDSFFKVQNTDYQLIANCFIFGLSIVAQLLLMMRFSFNWYLWVILNVLTIGLNLYTDNPIMATQYLIYLFNSTYGICEWKLFNKKEQIIQD